MLGGLAQGHDGGQVLIEVVMVKLVCARDVAGLIMFFVAGIQENDQAQLVTRVVEKLGYMLMVNDLQALGF